MAPTETRTENGTLYIERVFDAPKELMFDIWSDGEKISQWWGPKGWTTPVSKMDFRVGGTWHYMMKGPDDGSEWANMEAWGIGTYISIDPPDKIIYEDAFTDESGKSNEDMPISKITVEFISEGEQTRLVTKAEYPDEEKLKTVLEMGMVEGFTQQLDRLDDYLIELQK